MDGSHKAMLHNSLKIYTGAIEHFKKGYRDGRRGLIASAGVACGNMIKQLQKNQAKWFDWIDCSTLFKMNNIIKRLEFLSIVNTQLVIGLMFFIPIITAEGSVLSGPMK